MQLAQRSKTDSDIGGYKFYYDDPLTTYDYFEDLYDPKIKYKLLKYATHIKYNNFTSNYAGMKGTAVLLSFINAVEVEDNYFFENGPVTSFSEAFWSPFYKYFALGEKLITFNSVPRTLCQARNEISYVY